MRKKRIISILSILMLITVLSMAALTVHAAEMVCPDIDSYSTEGGAVTLNWTQRNYGIDTSLEIFCVTSGKKYSVPENRGTKKITGLEVGETVKFKWRAVDNGPTSYTATDWKGPLYITVKGTPEKYTVSYDANGGSGAPSSQTKEEGKTLKLSTKKPTRSGYTFVGWSHSPNSDIEDYKAGGSYTMDYNTVLYAVWKRSYSNMSSLSLNTWTPLQYKENSAKLKYSFTLDEAGWIQPEMRIDESESGILTYGYVTNEGLQKIYSCSADIDSERWEDSGGKEWKVQKFEKMRLPAGSYYFYFPSDSLAAEYGYFKLKMNYSSEEYKDNVETEFNNSRSTADKISFSKTYRGNIGCNGEDVDYYKIKLTKKKTVTVTMYYPVTNQNWSTWEYCQIRSKGGNTLAEADYCGTYEDSNGTVWHKAKVKKKLKKGTYYIRIAGLYMSDDYKFKVKKK